MSVSRKRCLTMGTQQEDTHAEANSYSIASSHSLAMSRSVASGFTFV